MIARKKKICVDCGTEQFIFSKGKCKLCASKNTSLKGGGFIKVVKKPKSNKKELDTYFEQKITQLNKTRVSEESGKPIPFPTRGNICHLLDKSSHKSVAHHPENYVFLTWEEHGRFDQLLFAHEFKKLEAEYPNSWKLVLKRLESVIPSCTEKTRIIEALKNLTDI